MGRQNINVAAIAQTSESGSTPQGNLAAQATFGGDSGGFVRSFTEHGVIIGLICIDADQNYQAGMDRSFMRSTKYDYYWPALQNIGEQVVYANEIDSPISLLLRNLLGIMSATPIIKSAVTASLPKCVRLPLILMTNGILRRTTVSVFRRSTLPSFRLNIRYNA